VSLLRGCQVAFLWMFRIAVWGWLVNNSAWSQGCRWGHFASPNKISTSNSCLGMWEGMFALSSLCDLVFGGFSFLPWSHALGYSNYSFAFYVLEGGCYAETVVQLSFLNAISHNRGNCNPFCLGHSFQFWAQRGLKRGLTSFYANKMGNFDCVSNLLGLSLVQSYSY